MDIRCQWTTNTLQPSLPQKKLYFCEFVCTCVGQSIHYFLFDNFDFVVVEYFFQS